MKVAKLPPPLNFTTVILFNKKCGIIYCVWIKLSCSQILTHSTLKHKVNKALIVSNIMHSARLCVLVFVSAVLTKYFIFSQQNLIVSYLFILNHKNTTFVIRYKKPRIACKDGIHNEVLFRRISKPNLAYDVHESTVKRPSDNNSLMHMV